MKSPLYHFAQRIRFFKDAGLGKISLQSPYSYSHDLNHTSNTYYPLIAFKNYDPLNYSET